MNVLSVLKFFMVYVITDKRGEYKFIVKGREVEASFTEQPNPDIVPQLKTILLGDANPPAYKRAKREPKEERTWNIDMDRVRSAIPAEIPDEEMEDYTEKALEYYQQLLQKKKARDAR